MHFTVWGHSRSNWNLDDLSQGISLVMIDRHMNMEILYAYELEEHIN